jgi:hypothetical protein
VSPVESGNWGNAWLWGIPLTVLTTVIHVIGLAYITERVALGLGVRVRHRRFVPALAIGLGLTVLLATLLHWIEAFIWAAAFIWLGALPDFKSAMLYSLGAITAYGHASLFLRPHWQILGAIEALNGMILFGLSTAFLFGMIQKFWPLGTTRA